MRCPQCHHDNSTSAKFCSECGAKLEHSGPACGAVNALSSRFCQQCGQSLPPAKSLPSGVSALARQPDTVEASAAPREERRWATVLFADLSDFTALSERMDAEDVKAL